METKVIKRPSRAECRVDRPNSLPLDDLIATATNGSKAVEFTGVVNMVTLKMRVYKAAWRRGLSGHVSQRGTDTLVAWFETRAS